MLKAIAGLLSAAILLHAVRADAGPAYVRVETNAGAFTLELDGDKAPVAVANFLNYLDEGFYRDTIFHRSVPGFVVQGGGFDHATFPGNTAPKDTHDPIANESGNGLGNLRGTVAMARTSDPDSATSQFFVNVADNTFLDRGSAQNPDGYAVFGQVAEGMGTVDAINALPVAGDVYSGVPAVFQEQPLADIAGKTPVYITAIYRLQPTADAGPDQAVDENAAVVLDGNRSSDPRSAIAAWRWTQTAGPTVALSDPGTAHPRFVAPLVDADTRLSFDLVVTDAAGAIGSADTVDIRVRDVANPLGIPYAGAGTDFSVFGGAPATLDGSASSDSGGQSLAYRWTQIAGPAVALSDPASARPGFIAPAVRENTVLSFSLAVEDTDGNRSAPAVVNVTVKWRNTPPVADAGPGGTVRAGAILTLDGSGSFDPDTDPLTAYTWTAPAGILLSDRKAQKPTVMVPADAQGKTLTFALTVSDGEATSSPAFVAYTVVDNGAPVIAAGPQTVRENARVTLNATVTDPDGDAVEYSWRQTGGTPVSLGETDGPSLGFIAPWVSSSQLLQFTLTATDLYAAKPKSATATVWVWVDNDPGRLDCSKAHAYPYVLARPTGGLVPVAIAGIAAPKPGFKLRIDRVTSDEPVTSRAAGDATGPDAVIERGVPTARYPNVYDYALLRAERQVKRRNGKGSGNGRVYGIGFRASYRGQSCAGVIPVFVPGSGGQIVNDGQKYRATKAK
jgi:cyclophilin family peptidyl-prolyl cis-trans isomerase